MRFSTIIFGGTFDPPHIGHVGLVEKALEIFSPDYFLVIPSPEPPHKEGLKKTSFEARFSMTKLAFQHLHNVEVSDVEHSLPKPSYTFQTLEFLMENIKKPVGLLIGSDSLQNFDSWYRFEEILHKSNLIVYPRRCWPTEIPKSLFKFSDCIHIMEGDFFEPSSTHIRNGGEKMDESLTPSVLEYIRQNQLYQS